MKHNIPVVMELPGIGQNLKDHIMAPLKMALEPSTIPTVTKEEAEGWKVQWLKDQTGPLADDPALLSVGYHHLPNLKMTPEFQQLDEPMKKLLERPQTASFEMGSVCTPESAQVPHPKRNTF